MNFSGVSYFTLAAYVDSGLLRYLFFLMVLSLYLLILCANVLLIVVICKNRSLHEPMYLFLCSLFVNELYGSTGLFPFLLVQILSDVHTVSLPLCFLQIFCLFTYANVEFTNLVVMAYDRYLAICCPLQYNTHMTTKRVAMLIALIWLFPFVEVSVMISLSAPLQLCGNVINKVYCDNYNVVRLACYDTSVNNIYGIIYSIIIVGGVVFSVFSTYLKILKISFSSSKQTRQRAYRTCTPHLVSLLNFCFGGMFEICQSRFDMRSVPNMLRIFLSLYWIMCQPLLNPIIYGLNLTKIHILCKNLLVGKM